MKVKLGINAGFATNRYPEPDDWARIVGEELGLHSVMFVADLMSMFYPDEIITEEVEKINALKEQYKGQITFMGNMDIAGVLAFGTPSEVVADTEEHIERLSMDGRYICASSHSITDDVPPENYLAVIEACHA